MKGRAYLTSADYGDGFTNATPTWTYDAAGNRASDSTIAGSWVYDNLNRMTESPYADYTNDILGNRLSASDTPTYTSWDVLNRLTHRQASSNHTYYDYRADGMRVSKTAKTGSTLQNSTLYRYDGQMGIEDVDKDSSGSITAITRMALGTRGADAISRTTSSGTVVSYPLYDESLCELGKHFKLGWPV